MDTQSDVIVIGGGASGLAAAYELETQKVSYTLIEVKPRLGGSIITQNKESFVMDGGLFAFPRLDDWPTLAELELEEELIDINTPHTHPRQAFRSGTETLIHGLRSRLNGTIIKRMAVTGIGSGEKFPYRVCLENGLSLETRAIIVAVPARYASRIFRTFIPKVSDSLTPYYYDQVTNLALGYHAHNKPERAPAAPADMVFSALASTDHPARVPEGGLLIQSSVRVPLPRTTPERLLQVIVEGMGWNAPSTYYVNYWAEAAPLSVHGPRSPLHTVNDLLPDPIRLIGSCYQDNSFPELIEVGRNMAREIIATL